MDVFQGLNEQQAAAVKQIDGAMLVLAAAGSGKTTVLTRRIIHMIGQGISPKNILAVTFSNKAAEEMRSRIVQNVPNGMGKGVMVKTFHALCAEILRNERKALGNLIFGKDIDSFAICGSDECLHVVEEALVESELLGLPGLNAKGMQQRIDKAKNAGETIDDIKNHWQTRGFVDYVFLKIYMEYQRILQRNNCLDFNDLIMYVLELFQKDPAILSKYQNRFRYIMVDEYQDTNKLQYQLVQTLAAKNKNLCVVGDDDQSIYRFRGADVQNILRFMDEYPDAKVYKLEQNYRSSEYIVEIANSVISNNKYRMEKKMRSTVPSETVLRLGDFSSDEEEAKVIVQSIVASHQQGIPYSEIAVIYRINRLSKPIERELTKQGIPYRLSNGISILNHKETKDILAFLRLIDNPNDDIALQRIVNVPYKRFSAGEMDSLQTFARRKSISLWAAIQRKDEVWPHSDMPCGTDCFVRLMSYLQKFSENSTMEQLIREVLNQTGYEDFVNAHAGQYTMRYVKDLIAFAVTYDKNEPEGTLNEFLERVSLMTDIDNSERSEAVNLLSGHRCKGLEFDLVYLIGLEDGILPFKEAIEDSEYFDAMEEERRLFYVMLTRAKRFLFISSAQFRQEGDELVARKKSRFFRDMGLVED